MDLRSLIGDAAVSILSVCTPAIFGLVGVIVGGSIAAHNQHLERKRDRIREQLRDFYAPLLAMRLEILAKSTLRVKVHKAASEIGSHRSMSVKNKFDQMKPEAFEDFDKQLKLSNAQLEEDLIPLYRKMLAHYRSNLWLAEKSTLRFHNEFAEYVEIWNRYFTEPMSYEVLKELAHDEDKVKPLYQDIQDNFDRLSKLLKK